MKSTAGVQADIQSKVVDLGDDKPRQDSPPLNNQPHGIRKVTQYIDYFLVVSSPTPHTMNNIYLEVTDPRISVIYTAPEVTFVPHHLADYFTTKPTVIPPVHPRNDSERVHPIESLVWYLRSIHGSSSRAFSYQIPSKMFAVMTENQMIQVISADAIPCKESKAIDYVIAVTITKKPGTKAVDGPLEVFDSRVMVPGEPKYGYVWDEENQQGTLLQAKKRSTPDRYCWDFSAIDMQTQSKVTLILTYTV